MIQNLGNRRPWIWSVPAGSWPRDVRMVGRATEGSARGTEPEVFVSEDTVGTSEGPDPDHGSAEKVFVYIQCAERGINAFLKRF